jgi:hypothetical protein
MYARLALNQGAAMTITSERWRELCRQAAKERDPYKLIKLCDEINAILQHAGHVRQDTSPNETRTGTNDPRA